MTCLPPQKDWAIKPDLPMVITVAGDGEYTAPLGAQKHIPCVL